MRTKKTIPYPAAHNYIAHMWEYCPSPGINNSFIFFHTQDLLTKANQPNFPKRTTISFIRKTEVLKVLKIEKCVCDYCNWVKLPKQALSNQNRILIYLRLILEKQLMLVCTVPHSDRFSYPSSKQWSLHYWIICCDLI